MKSEGAYDANKGEEGTYGEPSNHHRRPQPPLAPSQGMRRGEGTNGNHDHSGQQNETVCCLQCGEPFGPASREITVRSTGTGATGEDLFRLHGPVAAEAVAMTIISFADEYRKRVGLKIPHSNA